MSATTPARVPSLASELATRHVMGMTEPALPFRDAMRRVAATVNVVTIIDRDGAPMGMTATAVSSLSAEPPSLLVCINQAASLHGSLGEASHFCINVLHREQGEVARTFSDSRLRELRFAEGWERDELGPPYLADALASFVCHRDQLIAFATHSICIGTACRIRLREGEIDPLVYLDGRYCGVS